MGKTLQFVLINTAAAGVTQLVALNAEARIKVVSYAIVAAGAVTVKFQSGGTDITGPMPFAANGGISIAGQAGGGHIMEAARGQALNINLGGAVQVSGHLAYYVEA